MSEAERQHVYVAMGKSEEVDANPQKNPARRAGVIISANSRRDANEDHCVTVRFNSLLAALTPAAFTARTT